MPLAGLAAWVVAALVGGFGQTIIHGIVKLFIAMGFGFIAYQGVDILINFILENIRVNLSAVPPEMIGMLGVLKVDKALNVLASAYMARLVIKGITNGLMTKFGMVK